MLGSSSYSFLYSFVGYGMRKSNRRGQQRDLCTTAVVVRWWWGLDTASGVCQCGSRASQTTRLQVPPGTPLGPKKTILINSTVFTAPRLRCARHGQPPGRPGCHCTAPRPSPGEVRAKNAGVGGDLGGQNEQIHHTSQSWGDQLSPRRPERRWASQLSTRERGSSMCQRLAVPLLLIIRARYVFEEWIHRGAF